MSKLLEWIDYNVMPLLVSVIVVFFLWAAIFGTYVELRRMDLNEARMHKLYCEIS